MTNGFTLVPSSSTTVEHHSWGRLEWNISGPLGSSETLTVGTCFLGPGQANGRHRHECDEVLIVRRGRIMHSVGDDSFPMGPGDAVSIPAGQFHNAMNVSEGEAELSICFSSGYRTTEVEAGGHGE